MKLLFLSQTIDDNDTVLGFVTNWLQKLTGRFQSIEVICLAKGKCNLPPQVKVHSLGKERRVSRLFYLFNFYRYLFFAHLDYQAVLVHMNPEYILLAGWWWKLRNKKIFLWYNHAYGGWRAKWAAVIATKVFYTSPYAWAASLKNSQLMPVGVDTNLFQPSLEPATEPKFFLQILSLGRISPVKKIEVLLEAAQILATDNFAFQIDIYGQAPERDKLYYQSIRSKACDLEKKGLVKFYASLNNSQTPAIYRKHQVLVNLTPNGSFDKTIIEALSCGRPVLMCNQSLAKDLPADFFFKEGDASDLAKQLKNIKRQIDQRILILPLANLRQYVLKRHSLDLLVDKLYQFIHG